MLNIPSPEKGSCNNWTILRVSKLHTMNTCQPKVRKLWSYLQKVSLYCEGTRDLKTWIMAYFDSLMLQILSPPLPKRYFQISSKVPLTILARAAHIHALELAGLSSGGQKPFLPGAQSVSHQRTWKSSEEETSDSLCPQWRLCACSSPQTGLETMREERNNGAFLS